MFGVRDATGVSEPTQATASTMKKPTEPIGKIWFLTRPTLAGAQHAHDANGRNTENSSTAMMANSSEIAPTAPYMRMATGIR